ncbi:MAG: CysB family HTH-type transcriptional regulator [Magnetococcales bacterium]|nr:CysB family HTH-type transcriptional regulator [Magnetococcales bacterium]
MKLHQLRYLCEVARRGLNVTEAAHRLHTSQSGISRQIQLLEEELGTEVFVRNGKRLTGMTEPGQMVLDIAKRILHETENLRVACRDFSVERTGNLTIATTHTQACFTLPKVIQTFLERYPSVRLRLHQGNPLQVSEMVATGQAELGIATTETEADDKDLIHFPCRQWRLLAVVPNGHPLLKEPQLTLEALAGYPLITYDSAFAARAKIDQAFADHGLSTNLVLTAIDADVIKTYVELGLGVGIVAEMAYDPVRDKGLEAVEVGDLFGTNVTCIGIKRGTYLMRYTYDFIELFAPHLTYALIHAVLSGEQITIPPPPPKASPMTRPAR